jgi:hypothetical protein
VCPTPCYREILYTENVRQHDLLTKFLSMSISPFLMPPREYTLPTPDEDLLQHEEGYIWYTHYVEHFAGQGMKGRSSKEVVASARIHMEEEERALTGSSLLGRGAKAVRRSGGQRQDPHFGEVVAGSSSSSRRPPATIPTPRQPPSGRAPPAGRRRVIPPSRDALVERLALGGPVRFDTEDGLTQAT